MKESKQNDLKKAGLCIRLSALETGSNTTCEEFCKISHLGNDYKVTLVLVLFRQKQWFRCKLQCGALCPSSSRNEGTEAAVCGTEENEKGFQIVRPKYTTIPIRYY